MFRRAAFVWELCQKRRIYGKRDRLETPKQICENELIDIPTCTCSKERLLRGKRVRDVYMWKETELRDQNRYVKKCYFCWEISRKKGMRTKRGLSDTPTDMFKKSVQKWQKRPICEYRPPQGTKRDECKRCTFVVLSACSKTKKKAMIVDLMPSKKKGFPKNKKFPM